MSFLRSTTFRLAALIFLLQIAAGAGLLLLVQHLTHAQIAEQAGASAQAARDDLLAIERQEGLGALAKVIRTRADDSADTVLLLADRQGRARAGNLDAWPVGVPARTGGTTLLLDLPDKDQPQRVRLVAAPLRHGYRLLTGQVIDVELRTAAVVENAMASAFVIGLVFALFAAWLSARMIDRRLTATVTTARAVRQGDLERRVPVEGTEDAFDRLAGELNAMLDRIHALLAELRAATDGLAHDLKSPLGRLRSALERAAAEVREPAAQGPIDRALAEGEQLFAMVETALRISRAEAGIGQESFAPTDLSALLEDLAEVYGPVAEDQGFSIEVAAPVQTVMPVHRELLSQALANLIDNALKYGAGRIRLSLADAPEAVTVTVADQGQGIPPDQRTEALRRFGRLDTARSGTGAGLGLSLAAAVAKLHAGTLRLCDANPGLAVQIELPRPA